MKNKNTDDVFNLYKIDDLPESIRKQLKTFGFSNNTKCLLQLFEKKPILSINEILAGLYRAYKIEKNRTWVSGTLYNLMRKGLIKKNKQVKGYYEKVKN